ncbi:3-oxoacyl-[acyl-carrier-protein] synthase 3 [Planctomycetes bacterium Poly30]|uniref:3-oxoacyl-[acyl-carrier-protein] synthase 3 n=1 Tax=Saltatorellus ferox TaxID=2528018 RepID=A0A518EPE3_9BACT|nr:3-oxoacyl-[acyl-carrier-protein] synthase 3 [Planctomycetes bacterium Poly30]
MEERIVNSPIRPVRIAGIGRYLPETVVTNGELEERFGVPTGWIEEKTGVIERRRADVAGGETASIMGAAALAEALGDGPLELDLILNASGTPEQAIPDGGPLIQRALGLHRSGIPCFTVHATCLSFLAALDVAASMLTVGTHRRIAIVSTEIGSTGVSGVDPKSESLWGDAAAAVVLERTNPEQGSALERVLFRTWSEGADLTSIRGGGTKLHPSRPGAVPEDLHFQMNGPAVLQMCLRRAGRFFAELHPSLRTGGMDGSGPSERIDVAITHQPSKAGLEGMERFGVLRERTVVTLDRLGNCVAASIPCTLYEAIQTGRLQRGQRALLFGTGAGLSMAGALLTY